MGWSMDRQGIRTLFDRVTGRLKQFELSGPRRERVSLDTYSDELAARDAEFRQEARYGKWSDQARRREVCAVMTSHVLTCGAAGQARRHRDRVSAHPHAARRRTLGHIVAPSDRDYRCGTAEPHRQAAGAIATVRAWAWTSCPANAGFAPSAGARAIIDRDQ
jgi:hypothetical protein